MVGQYDVAVSTGPDQVSGERLEARGELVIEHGPGEATLRVEHGPQATNLTLEGRFRLAAGLDAEVATRLGLGGGLDVSGTLSLRLGRDSAATVEVEHDGSGTTATARVRVIF